MESIKKEEETNKVKVLSILRKLKEDNGALIENEYSIDKKIIEKVFSLTEKREIQDILLRLTVIDSMYSTQMNKRYYALLELAEYMHGLNQIIPLPTLFSEYIKKEEKTDDMIGNDKFTMLFNNGYGYDKSYNKSGTAVSLISKYAYFETHYNFPIYDSIVCEMYPRLWKYCGFDGEPKKLTVKNKKFQTEGMKTIVSFINAIDSLIEHLGGDISYDHLDRLLWFVGKIYRGNLSLIINKEDYKWCIENWDKDGNFNITQSGFNVAEAPFCSRNECLKSMFILARELKEMDAN